VKVPIHFLNGVPDVDEIKFHANSAKILRNENKLKMLANMIFKRQTGLD
jgi:hypothetical protein